MFTDPISGEKMDSLPNAARRERVVLGVVRGSSVRTPDTDIQLCGAATRRRRGVRGMQQDQGGLRLSLSLPPTSGAALHRKEETRGVAEDDR